MREATDVFLLWGGLFSKALTIFLGFLNHSIFISSSESCADIYMDRNNEEYVKTDALDIAGLFSLICFLIISIGLDILYIRVRYYS
jgi:hypothetical protein